MGQCRNGDEKHKMMSSECNAYFKFLLPVQTEKVRRIPSVLLWMSYLFRVYSNPTILPGSDLPSLKSIVKDGTLGPMSKSDCMSFTSKHFTIEKVKT